MNEHIVHGFHYKTKGQFRFWSWHLESIWSEIKFGGQLDHSIDILDQTNPKQHVKASLSIVDMCSFGLI